LGGGGGGAGLWVTTGSGCGMILTTVNKRIFESTFVPVKLNRMFFCQELTVMFSQLSIQIVRKVVG